MLLFKPEHVDPILSGRKTQTRRIWKKPRAKVGSVHLAKTVMLSREFFARLKILHVKLERLGDISQEDAKAEGGYTVESFKRIWIEINGKWDPDLIVHVVKFEKIS